MKILNVSLIRAWDNYTIKNEPISSFQLMERAARACCQYIANSVDLQKSITIVAGSGNNGGDGVALARLLYLKGYNVSLLLFSFGELSNDCQENINLLPIQYREIKSVKDLESYKKSDVLIDALLGSGISRPIKGELENVIKKLNSFNSEKIAIDIPSGLFSDFCNSSNAIFKSDTTLTFQLPKKSMIYTDSIDFTGKIITLDIGLDSNFLESVNTRNFWVDKSSVEIIKRKLNSHKGKFGFVLVIGGTDNTPGAPILCGLAAFNAGAGLVSLALPNIIKSNIMGHYPELMLANTSGDAHIENVIVPTKTNVIAIGPGLGEHIDIKNLLVQLFNKNDCQFVIDADALNCIAKNGIPIPENSILTPHLKEFERLLGRNFKNEIECLELAEKYAIENHCFLVLKGAVTHVFSPNGFTYHHITANSALSKGGTGDVLTGIISGLLAQDYPVIDAVNVAIQIHANAANLFCKDNAPHSLSPLKLIDLISKSILYLKE